MARVYQSRTVRSVLKAHEEQLRKQGSASVLARSGLSVPEEGVTAVDGDLQAESFVAGSAGWRLQAGGNAEFNDVTIRGAAVGIDAPVLIQAVRASAAGFSTSTTWTELAGTNVTVPAGCTRLRSSATARMYVINPHTSGGADGTGTDALYVQAGVGGNYSTATPTGISGNGGFATTVGLDSFDLNGLTPGATVRVSVSGACGYVSMAADVDNYANVVAQLIWLR